MLMIIIITRSLHVLYCGSDQFFFFNVDVANMFSSRKKLNCLGFDPINLTGHKITQKIVKNIVS
jgi:hypothetical protein